MIPFLGLLDRMGLPTRIRDEAGDRALSFAATPDVAKRAAEPALAD